MCKLAKVIVDQLGRAGACHEICDVLARRENPRDGQDVLESCCKVGTTMRRGEKEYTSDPSTELWHIFRQNEGLCPGISIIDGTQICEY